ncbi:sugar phosphate isomerase [Lentilactobacillus hilgardii]|uniref:sugar phosphate isomerase n=1 Tax=Lentilactobacillus hilgardii TaxID=1588 RepID=UPI00390CC214
MMNMNRFVLNTLLLQHDHDIGQTQLQLVQSLRQLGVSNIELRREYNQEKMSELMQLGRLRLNYRLTYFYSIPDNLFINGKINERILLYLSEAQLMGSSYLKMTLGDFHKDNDGELAILNSILPKTIELNIENDQTAENSDPDKLATFFKTAKRHGLEIGFVNDLGNWIYTNHDTKKVTEQLLDFTKYIHLKSYVLNEKGEPETVPFSKGLLDWQSLIAKFDKQIPIGLEYPTDLAGLEADLEVVGNSHF